MPPTTTDRVLDVSRTQDFEVTGRGDHAAWNKIAPVPMPALESLPNPAAYATWFKALWSEKGIYFLIDCTDPKITATRLCDMGELYREDVAEVFIWPDDSQPVYFEYEISPFNAELVLLILNNDMTYMGWTPFLYRGDRKVRKAVHVRGGKAEPGAAITGWSAEFFIPLTVLKPLKNAKLAPGVEWRVNVYRIDYDHRPQHHFQYENVGHNFHNFRGFTKFRFV